MTVCGLNSADVPLSNKQTNNVTAKVSTRPWRWASCGGMFQAGQPCMEHTIVNQRKAPNRHKYAALRINLEDPAADQAHNEIQKAKLTHK